MVSATSLHSNSSCTSPNMRFFGSLSFLVLALVAVVSSLPIEDEQDQLSQVTNGPHDLIVGTREDNDQLIYYQNVRGEYQISDRHFILYYNVIAPVGSYITQVKLLDQMNDGIGGEPTITEGGPGQSFVRFEFKVQKGHSIFYTAAVYAKDL